MPTADGTYTGYTYQNGVFTLTSAGATYTFAGQDTSGKVRIVAATGCKISLASGFNLDLTKFTGSSADDASKASPISLSTTATVSVEALGAADLRAGNGGAGIRVANGQSLILLPSRTSRMFVRGNVGAGIGGGYSENCGNIEIRGGHLYASSIGDGSGIGDGGNAHVASHYSKITIGMTAHVEAVGGANGPGIGMTMYSGSDIDILITGGATVVASAGSGRSAGIGVSWRSEGSCSVTINDGSTVTATGGTGGAGIGSATESTTSMQIYIGNAKVTATGGADAAGIGGGNTSKTPTVRIMDGTVFAKGDPDVASVNDIGAGRNPKASATSRVTGGSVRLANGKGALTDDGTALNCVTVGGLAADGAVSVSLTTSKRTYGSSGIYADASGCIYLWVPPADYSSIYVNNVRYTADARSGNAMAHSAQPPANDNFANAKVVSGASGRVSGSNVAATRESGLYVVTPSDTYNVSDPSSVWYSWTASFTGTVCFQAEVLQEDVESIGGRLDISAYAGTSGSQLRFADDLSNWACTPEDEGFWGGRVRFNCTKGTTYKIMVYSSDGVEFPAFVLAWDTADKADGWVASFGRDGTAKISGIHFSGSALIFPASLFGCQVTEIGDSACEGVTWITSVTIPEGVTKIGPVAFRECIGLTSVTMPSTMEYIGVGAFAWCSNLSKVVLRNGLRVIANMVFWGCSLTELTVPETVTAIGVKAFGGSYLKTVTYKGNCPLVFDGRGSQVGSEEDLLYTDSPSTLVSHVPVGNTTWAEALAAGTWMDRAIKAITPNTYTVQFHKYDGSGATAEQTFKVGETKSLLWMDSQLHWMRDGYEFVGWVPWNPDSKPRVCKYVNGQKVKDLAKEGETVHLWCGWKSSSSYRVCFNKNDGSGTKLNQVILRNKEDTLAWLDSQLEWTRPGYTFKGWAETATGAVKYANGAKVKNLAMNGGTKNLYAIWAGKQYKVQYHKYDGSGATKEQTMTMGKAQRLLWMDSQLGWMRDGYEFVGWVPWNPDSKARVCRYANGESVKDIAVSGGVFSETVHLWCGWKSSSSYRVCFNKNDGSGTKLNQVILRNKEANLAWLDSLLEWTREGYSFQGWAETASGAVKYANGAKVKNLAMNGGTKNLYAVWKAAKSSAKLLAFAKPAEYASAEEPGELPGMVVEGETADGGAFRLVVGEGGAAVLYLFDGEGWSDEQCEVAAEGGVIAVAVDGGVAYRVTLAGDVPLLE